MSDIVIAALNARYSHTAFGARYLLANMGALRPRTLLLEFNLGQDPAAMADTIAEQEPAVAGFGIYIWNRQPLTEVVKRLRERCPETCIILGGPEVSFDPPDNPLVQEADYVIRGEADQAFAEVCEQILAGKRPAGPIIEPDPPELAHLELPYEEYTDTDVAQRLVYVEASRGCPYQCEYCISALDTNMRRFAFDRILSSFEKLIVRGVQHFKFVDRTMNADIAACAELLDFFLDRYRPGMTVHFEMVPDRLPHELKERILRFPEGALHLEIGIQTYNEDVAARIKRRTNYAAADENIRFLCADTGAHVHVDLIAGLPGESIESIAEGFDRAVALNPHELQFGILKKLSGAPIARHDDEWKMRYNSEPPYDIVSNRLIDEETMAELKRFARLWDRLYNRGDFVHTLPLLWSDGDAPFNAFRALSAQLYRSFKRTHSIQLVELAEGLFDYLVQTGHDPHETARTLWNDYHRQGRRRNQPVFLRKYLDAS